MANATNTLVASGTKPKVKLSVALQSEGMQRMLSASFNGDKKAMMKFTSDLMAVATTNPTLSTCDPASLVSVGLQASSMNLSMLPSLGEAYAIPYGDKAQFQVGKNGLVQLAIRTGQYLDIDSMEIRKGEYKGRDKATGKYVFEFIEDDEKREELPVVGYMAYFEMLNGFRKVVYFSKEKMLSWAKRYSKAFDTELHKKYEAFLRTGTGLTKDEEKKCSSPWYSNFDAMGEKTVLKQLLSKWGVKSTELISAISQDEVYEAKDAADDFFAPAEEEAEKPKAEEDFFEA